MSSRRCSVLTDLLAVCVAVIESCSLQLILDALSALACGDAGAGSTLAGLNASRGRALRRGNAGGRAGAGGGLGGFGSRLWCSLGDARRERAGRNAGGRGSGASRCAGDGRSGAQAGLGLLRCEAKVVGNDIVDVTELSIGTLCRLSVVVAGAGGSGTVGGGRGVLGVVASQRSGVLASKSDELVALATLWHLDAVAVGPLLDLAVAPAFEKLVAQRLSSGGGGLGGRGVLRCGFVGSDLRVAAKRGNELITVAWLWDWDSTLIKPCLQIRVGPLRVQPVAWVGGSLACLVGGLGVVGASGVEERVAGAR